MNFALVALLALVIEALVGYPQALFARIGHPVTWIGALIGALDKRLNRDGDTFARRRAAGGAALALVIAPAFLTGFAVEKIAAALPCGALLAALLASTLLAQRSLHAHVAEVSAALCRSLDDGRAAVAKIVGRDVAQLDEAGVARAAIESLSENFSDGVVAPAFYLALFGLPGAAAYKAVNTADSMIGHKTGRYLAFGWAAARSDDLLNLVPARLSAALIAAGAMAAPGAAAFNALSTALRDARKHVSPNAGWPEAAMAGALGVALGGPRAYGDATLKAARLGDGRLELSVADIDRALSLYRRATAALWLLVAIGAAIFS